VYVCAYVPSCVVLCSVMEAGGSFIVLVLVFFIILFFKATFGMSCY